MLTLIVINKRLNNHLQLKQYYRSLLFVCGIVPSDDTNIVRYFLFIVTGVTGCVRGYLLSDHARPAAIIHIAQSTSD